MFDPLTAPHRCCQQTVNVGESTARLQAATLLLAIRREGGDDGVPFHLEHRAKVMIQPLSLLRKASIPADAHGA